MMALSEIGHRRAPATPGLSPGSRTLGGYYFVRAAVAACWVAAAFTAGRASPVLGALLLVGYPAWDAGANLFDAIRSDSLRRNSPQLVNAAISTITALAIGVTAVRADSAAMLQVFGGWALLAGLLQAAAGGLRWRRHGAQWAMILSGVQSALAGGHFIARSFAVAMPVVTTVAPYAAFGAFYFLVSAIWLSVSACKAAG